MADPQADIRTALAEAIQESEFPTDEKVAEESWEGDVFSPDESAAADDTAEPSKGEAPDDGDDEPKAEEAQVEDVTEYWGVPLDGIPAEQKAEILAKLQQQDSYISKLQERLAKEPETPAPAPASDDEEVTDQDLLLALGFNPEELEYDQVAPRVLPLARTILALEEKVDQLSTKAATQEVETQWNSQLDELETTYGTLPFDRVQVLRYAIEENIPSPFEVYFRLTAPARREVETTVADARRLAAKKAEGGGVKPRSSGSESAVIDPQKTSLHDAVRISMAEAEKETGLKFRDLFKGHKVKVSE